MVDVTSVYPNSEFMLREPFKQCEIKFVTRSTSLDFFVAGNRMVLKIWRLETQKSFQLKIEDEQMFTIDCFSLPPSSNYLDPVDLFLI